MNIKIQFYERFLFIRIFSINIMDKYIIESVEEITAH